MAHKRVYHNDNDNNNNYYYYYYFGSFSPLEYSNLASHIICILLFSARNHFTNASILRQALQDANMSQKKTKIYARDVLAYGLH